MRFKLLALLVLCSVEFAFSQPFQDQWALEKSFKVTPITEIEINNKYGMFQVHEWDKDSLKIEISVHVQENSLEKLDKVRNGIDFSFLENTHYLIIETKLTAVTLVDDIRHSVLNDDRPVEINYNIYLPNKNKLKLTNKYGDIFMGSYKGDLDIDLSYGKLKAYELAGKSKLKLSFADASVKKMNIAEIILDYSEFESDKINYLQMQSKSSEMNIVEIGELQLKSKRDKIFIDKLERLKFDGAYSDAKFKNVTSNAFLSVKYGDVDVYTDNPEFIRMQVTSKYADIVLGFDKGEINYDVDLVFKNVKFTYPRSLSHLQEDLSLLSDKLFHYKGWMGLKKIGSSAVSVNAEYGSVLLLHR